MTTAAQHLSPVRIRLWLKPRPIHRIWLEDLVRVVRKTVRDEFRAGRDQNSFAAAAPWLTQGEAQAYLKMSRTTIYGHRTARKLAKTAHAKANAFVPDYGSGPGLRLNREELDAWLARKRSD